MGYTVRMKWTDRDSGESAQPDCNNRTQPGMVVLGFEHSAKVAVSIALFCLRAFAEDSQKFAYGVETDFNSGHVWHGIVLSDRPVLRPSGWISRFGLTLSGSTMEGAGLHFTDLGLTYERDWNKLRIEPAIEAYLDRPPAGIHDPNTMEGSLKLSYPAGPLRAFTLHAFDVLAYKGAYFGEAGLGYEGRVRKRTGLAASFHSGWASSKFNGAYIGFDKAAVNFIGAEGSLTYYLRPYLYLRPHFEFNSSAGRLREYLSPATLNLFGLAVGVEF